MRKLLYFLVSFFIYCAGFPTFVHAAGEFRADYEVNYTVATSAVTIVTQNITLTNKLTNLYPKQYTITIDSDKIRNVIASDNGGIITPQIDVKDGKTEITLEFNERVVGLEKNLFFTLRYENGDIAQKNGNIWEINVPGVEDDPDLGTYRVALSVPPSFGANAYLTPLPADRGYWTKDQMTNGGISAAYGSEQAFDFNLSYYLTNPSLGPKRMDIALPPETSYQDILIKKLSPEPKTVTRDSDGNWLATYELSPHQSLDIQANVLATVYLQPKAHRSASPIKPDDYLKPTSYWQVFDPKIVALAGQYQTPREIYDYVVATLSYDYQRVNENPLRRGALGALASPKQAICMEFTDLFIAIARAAGIPAREVVGYAYTTNSRLRPLSLVSDVLHAWPEYYDREKQLWVPVDPTWANTTGGVNYFDKLDFNHIVFAIHGLLSDYPYPAGFYRNSTRTGKDIQVRFADVPRGQTPEILTVEVDFPKKITAGFSTSGKVIVHNLSGKSIPEANIFIESTPGDTHIQRTETNIPPYGNVSIPISIVSKSLLSSRQGRILVTVNGQTESYVFRVQPLYWVLIPVGAIVCALAAAIWFVSKKRNDLWKFLKR